MTGGIFLKKFLKLAVMLAFLAAMVLAGQEVSRQTSADGTVEGKRKVVLDPGHGGKDPGKVGIGEVLEKDLNLNIAQKVGEELEKLGVQVIFTRTQDKELDPGEEGGRKLADMKARVKLINKEAPDLAVSIHQNSYLDPTVRGIQVFYYTGSLEGEQMALQMEREFESLEETKVRKSKANDDYYLLKNTQVPTLIVECGFLSCPDEVAILTEEDYQRRLAAAIAGGILACMGD